MVTGDLDTNSAVIQHFSPAQPGCWVPSVRLKAPVELKQRGDWPGRGVELGDPAQCYLVAAPMLLALHRHAQHHCVAQSRAFFTSDGPTLSLSLCLALSPLFGNVGLLGVQQQLNV